MTLKELAQQLNKPVGEVIKALAKNGFKGIYKNDHNIPSAAVQVVVDVLTKSPVSNALPSANPDTIQQVENTVPVQQEASPNNGIEQLKDRVENSFNAVGEARQHTTKNSYQQEVDNKALAGVIAALAGQASYNEAYLKTVGILYSRDIQEQNKAINTILETITDPDFFGVQTSAESYFKLSKVSSDNSLLKQATEATEQLTK